MLWNVVPTHPGTAHVEPPADARARSRRGRGYADELAAGRRVVAVGRVAADALGAPYVRHPSHGGAAEFALGLHALIGRDDPGPP